MTSKIGDNLASIQQRIEQLAIHHSQPCPELLAVSKYHPAESIREAWDCGQRQFGENYVQELVDKASALPEIEWHFIGHLQSNKCKALLRVPNLKRISSVDSINLATKLESACAELGRTVEVLVQVGATGEETKTGKFDFI